MIRNMLIFNESLEQVEPGGRQSLCLSINYDIWRPRNDSSVPDLFLALGGHV